MNIYYKTKNQKSSKKLQISIEQDRAKYATFQEQHEYPTLSELPLQYV